MNLDQLLFTASDCNKQAGELLEKIWNEQHGKVALSQAHELAALARTLSCAATEIENRARGFKEPVHRHD